MTLFRLAVVHVGGMMVSAIVLCAAIEAVNYGLMAIQERKRG